MLKIYSCFLDTGLACWVSSLGFLRVAALAYHNLQRAQDWTYISFVISLVPQQYAELYV